MPVRLVQVLMDAANPARCVLLPVRRKGACPDQTHSPAAERLIRFYRRPTFAHITSG